MSQGLPFMCDFETFNLEQVIKDMADLSVNKLRQKMIQQTYFQKI